MATLALPGPRSRFYSTWKFMRDPYSSLAEWKGKYGNTFLVPAMNGDVVITGSPENARRIFAAPADAVGPFAIGTVKSLIGESSVLLVEGEQHQRSRALMSPCFHGDAINSHVQTICDVAMQSAQGWQPEQPVCIMDAALEISLEVIIRVVFGVQSQKRVDLFKQKITQYVDSFHPALAFSKLLQRPLLGLSPWNRFLKARRECDELIAQELVERRATSHQADDILSRLLNATDPTGAMPEDGWIRDQLITMLFAGHETTQIAIAWAMSWIHRNPTVLRDLQDELRGTDSPDEILQSQLLQGVCYESLRLNPILADVIRTLKKPMELEDIDLPAGSAVSIAIYLIHSDPEIFPQPMVFNPDRWKTRDYKPFEFLPFGGGIRRCLGAPLAMMEMKLVVATLVKHFDFSLPKTTPEIEPIYRRNVTLAPRSGISLVFRGKHHA